MNESPARRLSLPVLLGWLAVIGAGAFALGIVTFSRGEQINAL
ncbi:MAG: hypothetical protein RIQ71_61, partial [Verrucomicrobiota bacterium]